ncbi:hypothetical protein M0802_008754 [Mischocyttarus mexicanus]|nr:hypothetical protein M0802_008754 [Mischocyttarus mexicanus]
MISTRTEINGFNPEPIEARTLGVGLLVQAPGSFTWRLPTHEFDTWITHAEVANTTIFVSTLSYTLYQ